MHSTEMFFAQCTASSTNICGSATFNGAGCEARSSFCVLTQWELLFLHGPSIFLVLPLPPSGMYRLLKLSFIYFQWKLQLNFAFSKFEVLNIASI